MEAITSFIGKVGAGVSIETPFYCTWGCNIFLEDGVYMNRKSAIPSRVKVSLERFLAKIEQAYPYSTTHP